MEETYRWKIIERLSGDKLHGALPMSKVEAFGLAWAHLPLTGASTRSADLGSDSWPDLDLFRASLCSNDSRDR